MISVGITTFKKRLKSVESMVDYLKSCDSDVIINLAINGEVEEDFDEEYRKGILNLCLKYNNIFPTFHQEFRALAKLWNTLVINSKTEYNIILNDDLTFNTNQNFLATVKSNIEQSPHIGFFRINHSFSHFVVTKHFLDKINYFDERFLLIGEEDNDLFWRFEDMFGYPPDVMGMGGVYNAPIDDPTKIPSNVELGQPIEGMLGYAKERPRFNQEFLAHKYRPDAEAPNTHNGMGGYPHKRILGDEKQYPYESFYLKNKKNLSKFDKIEF